MLQKLSKVMMAGIAGLMLMSGLASGAPPVPHQFDVVMTVDIEADLDSSLINVKRKNTNNRIIFQLCTPNCVPFTLGAFWGDQTYGNGNDGTECFPPRSDVDLRSDVQGSIHLTETRNGDARATFFFRAKADDGDDDFDVKYQLILTDFDNGWDGVFPPPGLGDTAEMMATGWEMRTEGKGQFRQVACKGMGMETNVIIVLSRIL